jgi:hypothetical protein
MKMGNRWNRFIYRLWAPVVHYVHQTGGNGYYTPVWRYRFRRALQNNIPSAGHFAGRLSGHFVEQRLRLLPHNMKEIYPAG